MAFSLIEGTRCTFVFIKGSDRVAGEARVCEGENATYCDVAADGGDCSTGRPGEGPRALDR
jgi:hypothetical protein